LFLAVAGTSTWLVLSKAEDGGAFSDSFIPATESLSLQPGCETTFMIVRHCEDLGSDVKPGHCSYVGLERASYFRTLFGEGSRWPEPSRLIAYTTSPDGLEGVVDHKDVEFLTPLSEKFGLDVETFENTTKLAENWLSSVEDGSMCGKLTLVSWNYAHIVELAKALGCGSAEGCPKKFGSSQFDEVIQIKRAYSLTTAYNTKKFYDRMDSFAVGRRTTELSEHKPENSWSVYGYVTYQYFDPLAFSYVVGDYPAGGTAKGGKWIDYDL